MVYLEAASNGLPVAAFDNMGVPLVVRHGQTGLLAPLNDLSEFRKNLTTLLTDNTLRQEMGRKAIQFVNEERNLTAAATHLKQCLAPFESPDTLS